METVRWTLETERRHIAYLRHLIESYDGMAVVRTVDPQQAVIELMIAPGCRDLIMDLLSYLRNEENIKIHLLTQA
ncbi:MAG: DUF4911 domain-containing protein [Desulfobacteraceae bacterium]|nr:MAG: DUF4911 domain-containing protein [Desulfobacteraceae bacterium]